jgi:hypothetical protein
MGGTDTFIGHFNTLMAKICTAMDAGAHSLIEYIF